MVPSSGPPPPLSTTPQNMHTHTPPNQYMLGPWTISKLGQLFLFMRSVLFSVYIPFIFQSSKLFPFVPGLSWYLDNSFMAHKWCPRALPGGKHWSLWEIPEAVTQSGPASSECHPIKYAHGNSLQVILLTSAERRDSIIASDWASLLSLITYNILTGKPGKREMLVWSAAC